MVIRSRNETKVTKLNFSAIMLRSFFFHRFQKRIYIGLPEADARRTMFKLHLGKTKHILSDEDFNTLANISDKYSGADIQNVVIEALMQPVKRLQKATHFMKVSILHAYCEL